MNQWRVLDLRTWPEGARLAGFAGVYGALMVLGHWLVMKPGFYPVCWPVAGFLLGVLLLLPTRRWWRWLAVAAPVALLVDGMMGVPWWGGRRVLAGQCGGRRGGGRSHALVGGTATTPSLRAGNVGPGRLGWRGWRRYGQRGWAVWFSRRVAPFPCLMPGLAQVASASLGVLALTPLLLVADEALDRLFRINRRQLAEVTLILLGVGGTVWLAFGWIPAAELSQAYFLLPMVIVVVWRLGLPGSAAAGAVLTLLVLGLTRWQVGQGVIPGGMVISYLISVQVFLLMTLFSVLLLGVVLKERQLAQARCVIRSFACVWCWMPPRTECGTAIY